MNDLLKQGIRNVILTSGTLSPLESFAAELKMYVYSISLSKYFTYLLNIMLKYLEDLFTFNSRINT